MSNARTWMVEQRVSSELPDDYKAHALDVAKRKASSDLYSILEQCPNPAVVEINEEIIQYPPMPYMRSALQSYSEIPQDRIRIEIKVTPVRYRNVEIAHGLSFDPSVFIDRPTFWRRLKYAITGK